ncbi:MAG: long-chain fatty acid--CoA ligase [Pseudomonadota bacterium]
MYSLTDFLQNNARSTPNAPATRFLDREQDWATMADRVARLAGALRDLGVEPGDRVAILSINRDRYLEYFFAVWWAGAAVVPMNTRWSPSESAYALKDAGAKILFVDEAFSPSLADILEGTDVEKSIFLGEGAIPVNCLDYEDLVAAGSPCEDAGRAGEDLAGLYYTGGTTGFPKGVMLSQRALWFNNISMGQAFRTVKGDVFLHAAPMFHLADGAFSGAATVAGICHAFLPSFDPLSLMNVIEEKGVTQSVLVPTMLGMLVNHPEFQADRLGSLRSVAYGASPMPGGLMQQLLDLLPWVNWVQGYGQTEMAPIISLLPSENHVLEGPHAGKLRSAGKVAMGVEVRICDEAGADLPNGEVGEIVTRSPGAMTGYWNRPEQTAEILRDGWVHTGDGAYRDDDGFIFIVDRLKDMIVSGGENVFSAEVESALSTHPAVEAVAVIGIPDDTWGEVVHAIVILKSDSEASEEDLTEHCKSLIASYKCPRSYTYRNEPLPLSGAGKVLKTELRKPFWEGQERGVG